MKPWKTLQVGDYWIDFPVEFAWRIGPMGQRSTIANDTLSFSYDIEYADRGPAVVEEYVYEERWRNEAAFQFWEPGKGFPCIKICEILHTDPADGVAARDFQYHASCAFGGIDFDYPIRLPSVDSNVTYQLDTLDHAYSRKIYVQPRWPSAATVGVYVKRFKDCDARFEDCESMAAQVNVANDAQKKLAIKIFKTLRFQRK